MTKEEILKDAKPMLFNTEMVLAILEGRKTCTRRIINPQPKMKLSYIFAGCNYGKWSYPGKDAEKYWGEEFKRPDELTYEDEQKRWSPPCHTDDILYVRETWNYGYIETSDQPESREMWFEPVYSDDGHGSYIDAISGFFYKADENAPGKDIGMMWRPSIHMPKRAARIFLKVTNVQMDRVQDVQEKDARKEGFVNDTGLTDGHSAAMNFAISWNRMVKEQWQYWEENPWVWVIEFERIDVDGES